MTNFQLELQELDAFPVLGNSFSNTDYVPLDLSVTNKDLKDVDVSSSEDLQHFVSNHIKTYDAKVAFGGYLEKRGIYNRSENFNKDNPETVRSIHLGVDLWIEANTPIYLPLEGVLHSFKDNSSFGNYGPTLIFEHRINTLKFYTLYGHLTIRSLSKKKLGQSFKKGEHIATLGTAEVNGDYPPHLHFQVIRDLQGNFGDYPGVSNEADLDFYKMNCPDPELLLNLQSK